MIRKHFLGLQKPISLVTQSQVLRLGAATAFDDVKVLLVYVD
jgi:hypothetical protein